MPTIETNDFETYYERRGNGQPIVLAHGSGWDHRSWAPQLEGLAPDYDVIAYDYRGHGKTGVTGKELESVNELAGDLRALVDELELETPIIGGCSLGGRIAYTYAAEYPEALDALVLHEAPWHDGRLSLTHRLQRFIGKLLARGFDPARANKLFTRVLSLFADGDPEEYADRYVPPLEMTAREYVDEAMELMDAAESEKIRNAERPTVDLTQISMPTLVLTGEEPLDRFEESAAEIVARVPDAERGWIPDGGHGAHMTNPVAWNARVRTFLKKNLE